MISIDLQYYPIVIATFSGKLTNDELKDYFERQQEVSRQAVINDNKYIVITFGSTSIDAEQRRMMSAWVDSIPKEQSARVIGKFVVIENPLMRGMLTAIKWTSRTLKDVIAAKDRAEAIAGALEILEREKIPPPPSLPKI